MSFRNIILIAVVCVLFFIIVPSVYAVQLLPSCIEEGSCTVEDMVGVIGRAAEFLLGIIGSVTLLMFIYGGFVWLTSGGSPERIKKGQQIIVQTVIGLAIVFGAYAGVHFLLKALGAKIPGVKEVQTECEKEYSDYECVDINTYKGDKTKCIKHKCPGTEDIQCCPKLEQ